MSDYDLIVSEYTCLLVRLQPNCLKAQIFSWAVEMRYELQFLSDGSYLFVQLQVCLSVSLIDRESMVS